VSDRQPIFNGMPLDAKMAIAARHVASFKVVEEFRE
jgi:hypothetical protein